jgi:ElaB/YqjD/DUF883 family membrane-anchored ribosome-binding protein
MNSTHLHAASVAADSRSRLDEGAEALARSKDELAAEFRALIREGEELVKSSTNLSTEALAQARAKFRGKLLVAKEHLGEVSQLAGERGRQVAIATDDYVHDSPWTAIGVAAGIAFVLGAMLTRRSG